MRASEEMDSNAQDPKTTILGRLRHSVSMPLRPSRVVVLSKKATKQKKVWGNIVENKNQKTPLMHEMMR